MNIQNFIFATYNLYNIFKRFGLYNFDYKKYLRLDIWLKTFSKLKTQKI